MEQAISELASHPTASDTPASTPADSPSHPQHTAFNAVVVIPTYNERQNISSLVLAIHEILPKLHVLVVDDSSPDGTAEEVAELTNSLGPHISLLSRSQKNGLAAAYIAGFKEALRQGYDVILQMDADGSHDPSYLPAFLRQLQSSDLVLGSRYLRGVNVVNWDFKRLLLSKMASVYVRWVTSLPFTDLTGGYKCWRRTALEKINLDRVFSNGYLFQIEMTWKAHHSGARIAETSIIFYEREIGRSKIDAKIILEAIWGVFSLPFRSKK
jgi:dolichol-phosphate mannosyltransferase